MKQRSSQCWKKRVRGTVNVFHLISPRWRSETRWHAARAYRPAGEQSAQLGKTEAAPENINTQQPRRARFKTHLANILSESGQLWIALGSVHAAGQIQDGPCPHTAFQRAADSSQRVSWAGDCIWTIKFNSPWQTSPQKEHFYISQCELESNLITSAAKRLLLWDILMVSPRSGPGN